MKLKTLRKQMKRNSAPFTFDRTKERSYTKKGPGRMPHSRKGKT